MLLDGHNQVACAAIVQEEKTLPKAPQRRSAELVAFRLGLGYSIGKVLAHLMNRQIGIEVCWLSSQGRNARVRIGHEYWSVAKVAADLTKDRFPFQDR